MNPSIDELMLKNGLYRLPGTNNFVSGDVYNERMQDMQSQSNTGLFAPESETQLDLPIRQNENLKKIRDFFKWLELSRRVPNYRQLRNE